MAEIFLSLGSNIKPDFYILQAVFMLTRHVKITGVSTFYETQPVGFTEQKNFYNGVIRGETHLSPGEFGGTVLYLIEASLGRTRGIDRYGPRTIDIDVLLYDELVDADLNLPHPDIFSRDYVKVCLCEIAPDLTIPGSEVKVKELARNVDASQFRPLFSFTEKIRKIARVMPKNEG